MALYVRHGMWSDAAKMFQEYEGEFDHSTFISYAEWLLSQDKFEDAMRAYRKAGKIELADEVLQDLTSSAIGQSQYKDAAYYFYLLSKQAAVNNDVIARRQHELRADLYYAYSFIHTFTYDPFTNQEPEVLFHVSRYVINSLSGSSDCAPSGVSLGHAFYVLATQSMRLESFKLARLCYEMLSRLFFPRRKCEELELEVLAIQAKSLNDNSDNFPVCYRCGTINPLLNPGSKRNARGDVCINCGHPFVRSFINFEVLPLVEFVPESTIGDEEALDLIRQPSTVDGKKRVESKFRKNEYRESKREEEISEGKLMSTVSVEDFNDCITKTLEEQGDTCIYTPVVVDVTSLLCMNRSDVFVCKSQTKGKKTTFYKNMLPEIAIALSQPCHRFFHLDEFEFAILSNDGKCIYSQSEVSEYGSM